MGVGYLTPFPLLTEWDCRSQDWRYTPKLSFPPLIMHFSLPTSYTFPVGVENSSTFPPFVHTHSFGFPPFWVFLQIRRFFHYSPRGTTIAEAG